MADITSLTLTGATWSSFGTAFTRVNELIARANDIGIANAITITGGSINNTSIGNITPASGTFTNTVITSSLILSGASLTIDDNSISGNKIAGGTITVDYAELSNAPSAANHATTKAYVDNEIDVLRNEMVAYTIIFGG